MNGGASDELAGAAGLVGGAGANAGGAGAGVGGDGDRAPENGGASGAGNEAGAGNDAGASNGASGRSASGGSAGNGGSVNSMGGTKASGGSGSSEPPKECTSKGDCPDPARPFCDASYRCVRCLSESDCPVPSGECIGRSCELGQCKQSPKPVSATCDDGVFCNGSDHCDGAGLCGSHANTRCAATAVCHEDTKTCCDANDVPVRYCGSVDEATDRAAVQEANEACGACGGYTRVYNNGCTEFHCKT